MFERTAAAGRTGAVALGVALCALASPAASAATATASATPRCGTFTSQAEAQASFAQLGGTPADGPRALDPDRDGVACETLAGPYAGYATIGFNRKRGFLFGVARMPGASGGFQCLLGNRYDAETPRRLNVYRVREGKPDRPILGEYGVGSAADPATGRLIWKANRRNLPPGRYYVAFEARIRLTPFGANQCPEFASRPALLPVPRGAGARR